VHVTGATGYLGAELVRLLPRASGERVEIRDAEATRALFERLRPRTVIHTAYRQEDASVNVEGSENVALAAASVGARLLHLSTDVVFDGRKGVPYVEEDPLSPVNEYGASKAEAERRVAAAHPKALIVRTSLIVGGATPSKHELAATGPGPWFTNEIRSPIQVTSPARCMWPVRMGSRAPSSRSWSRAGLSRRQRRLRRGRSTAGSTLRARRR
jgi:dTDP-4-dehydrorhamnose reductase